MKALKGIRIVEFAGLGPLEHTGMMLSDLGADVIRIVRPGTSYQTSPILRNRTTHSLDLKAPEDLRTARNFITQSDVVLEGMRPGTMERLGLGPNEFAEVAPKLVYARMTGWGQAGPMSQRAGHDINYLALTGALWSTRRTGDRPVPPLNLVGDIGGGSMFLIVGILAALINRDRTGYGSVIDASIVDGVSSLLQSVHSLRADQEWSDEPGDNLFDTGRPWYDVYRCADEKFIAVGAIEPQFYHELVAGLELDISSLPHRSDPQNWPALKKLFTEVFATRSRDDWAQRFEQSDACVTAVLSIAEAPAGHHLRSRNTLFPVPGGWSASPAPRFTPLVPE
ncbi:alpha-methylacyl-CoA racemase [Leucobacter exalbidus]|uniref:Alpha-methylacyl-CoA racemase n=1 Tax=Leucobacter exalbidus TaxID=662960 RepID=A0A940T0E7_9MICO|nr:CaiB/BaiF CoA-transferase family protein [Leucobacter exalbidus]MBP1325830.1 alpha-methylacyl-CoA racemase [Leucobacter exalbidus]